MHQEVNRIIRSPSGIGAIHSPWARRPLQVLDTIGQVVAPKLEQAIPGTEEHHQALIRGGEGVLNEEEKRATEEAQQEKMGAEKENQQAEAQARLHPKPTPPKYGSPLLTDKGYVVPNDTDATARPLTGPNGEPIQAGERPKADLNADFDEAVRDAQKRGVDPKDDPKVQQIATAIHLKDRSAAEHHPNEYEDFKADYLKNKPKATAAEIQKAFETNKEKPERPKTELVAIPDDKGGYKTVEVGAGASLPAGARTIGGISTEATKTAEAGDAAKKTQVEFQRTYDLAQNLAKDDSPTSDAALIMLFMGSVKPESMQKIRFQKNEQDFFEHTRSSLGDLEALYQKVAKGGQKLIPEQRQQMLKTMKMFVDAFGRQGEGGGRAGASHEPTIEEINAEVARRRQAKQGGK